MAADDPSLAVTIGWGWWSLMVGDPEEVGEHCYLLDCS